MGCFCVLQLGVLGGGEGEWGVSVCCSPVCWVGVRVTEVFLGVTVGVLGE